MRVRIFKLRGTDIIGHKGGSDCIEAFNFVVFFYWNFSRRYDGTAKSIAHFARPIVAYSLR